MTPADVIIILQRDNQPVAFLSASHIIGKALAEKLGTNIQGFEKDLNITIPSLDSIVATIIEKQNAESK